MNAMSLLPMDAPQLEKATLQTRKGWNIPTSQGKPGFKTSQPEDGR